MFFEGGLAPLTVSNDAQLSYLNRQRQRTTDPSKLANIDTAIAGVNSGRLAPGGTDWVNYYKNLEMGASGVSFDAPAVSTGAVSGQVGKVGMMDYVRNLGGYADCLANGGVNCLGQSATAPTSPNNADGSCSTGDLPCYIKKFGSSFLAIVLGLLFIGGAFLIYRGK